MEEILTLIDFRIDAIALLVKLIVGGSHVNYAIAYVASSWIARWISIIINEVGII